MFGTDLEVFVWDSVRDVPVPATVFGLGGKDGDHQPLYIDGEKVGAVHRDNLMLEMTVDPQQTVEDLADAVRRVMYAGGKFVRDYDDTLVISRETSARFTSEELDTREARDIGCDVDFIAACGDARGRAALGAVDLQGLRYPGGHLHVSYDTALAPPWVGAVLCDHFVGLPAQKRLNTLRARHYGLAALHRPTFYPDLTEGVEYRVLDSFWVHQPDMSVLRGLGLVGALLTPQYVDVVRELVGIHMRNVPEGAVLAEIDEVTVGMIRAEARLAMQTLAPELAEEYHDSV